MRKTLKNDHLLFIADEYACSMLKKEITDTNRLPTNIVDVIRWSSNCMACMAPFTCKLYIPSDRYGVAKKEKRGSKALIRRIVEYFSACLSKKPRISKQIK